MALKSDLQEGLDLYLSRASLLLLASLELTTLSLIYLLLHPL